MEPIKEHKGAFDIAYCLKPYRRNQDLVKIIERSNDPKLIFSIIDGWHNEEMIAGNKEGREVAEFVAEKFPEIVIQLRKEKNKSEKELITEATNIMDTLVLEQWSAHASCVGSFVFVFNAENLIISVGTISTYVYRNGIWEKPKEIGDYVLDNHKHESGAKTFFGRGELKHNPFYSAKPDYLWVPHQTPIIIVTDGMDSIIPQEEFIKLLNQIEITHSAEEYISRIYSNVRMRENNQTDDLTIFMANPIIKN